MADLDIADFAVTYLAIVNLAKRNHEETLFQRVSFFCPDLRSVLRYLPIILFFLFFILSYITYISYITYKYPQGIALALLVVLFFTICVDHVLLFA